MKNFPVDVWWPVYEANAAHFAVFGVSGVVHQRVYRGLGHGGMSRVHGALAESVERRTRTAEAGERRSETGIQISEGKEEKASREEDGGRERDKEQAIPRSKRVEKRRTTRREADGDLAGKAGKREENRAICRSKREGGSEKKRETSTRRLERDGRDFAERERQREMLGGGTEKADGGRGRTVVRERRRERRLFGSVESRAGGGSGGDRTLGRR